MECIQQIANSLVKKALQVAFDPDCMSPFAISASEHGIQCIGKVLTKYCVSPVNGATTP
jgi:hypothetical protein